MSVATIMSSWTKQSGFPIIHVYRNYNTGTIELTQGRYFGDQPNYIDTTTWWIPMNFVSANDTDFSGTTPDFWFPQGQTTYRIEPGAISNTNWTNDEWIVCNKRVTGFYRIQYDRRNYRMIAEELLNGNMSKIHRTNRAQIIQDAFEFAKKGTVPYSLPLNLTKYIAKERELLPWSAWASGVKHINKLIAANSLHYGLFKVGVEIFSDLVVRLSPRIFNFIKCIVYTYI